MKTIASTWYYRRPGLPLHAGIFILILAFILFFSIHCTAGNTLQKLPSGLIFRIAVPDEVNCSSFWKYQPISFINNKTEFGAWNDYWAARKERLNFIANGFDVTEIVAYYNNKKITLEEAFAIGERSRKSSEEHTVTIEQLDSLLKIASVNETNYYLIVVPAHDKNGVSQLLKVTNQVTLTHNDKGEKIYQFGKFKSEEDAQIFVSILSDSGIGSAYVVSCQFQNSPTLAQH